MLGLFVLTGHNIEASACTMPKTGPTENDKSPFAVTTLKGSSTFTRCAWEQTGGLIYGGLGVQPPALVAVSYIDETVLLCCGNVYAKLLIQILFFVETNN